MTAQPNVIPIQPDNPSLSRLRDLVEQQWQTHGPESAIDGLRLTRALEPSGTIRALYQTSFCTVLQGAKVTAVGESAFHYRQGECLLASVNVPVNSRIVQAAPDKPYLALSLSIDPAMISESSACSGCWINRTIVKFWSRLSAGKSVGVYCVRRWGRPCSRSA